MTGDNEYDGPVPFKNCDYYFHVGFGEVKGPDEVSWEHWMDIEGFKDLMFVLKMWSMYGVYPAVEVDMRYRR